MTDSSLRETVAVLVERIDNLIGSFEEFKSDQRAFRNQQKTWMEKIQERLTLHDRMLNDLSHIIDDHLENHREWEQENEKRKELSIKKLTLIIGTISSLLGILFSFLSKLFIGV